LDKRSLNQKLGIKKRFPSLADDIIQSSWSGVVSRTRNSSQIFEKVEDNVFVAVAIMVLVWSGLYLVSR